MSEKKEIIFNTSMTADKRNSEFAYLRKNAFDSRSKGFYPSVDFTRELPDVILDTDDIVDILGSEESASGGTSYDIKVIVERGSDLRFYNLGSNSTSNTGLTGVDYECGTFGNDGVHICVDGDKLYKVQHVNSNTTAVGVTTGAFPDIAGFDGLYYWWLSSNEIYKQVGSASPTLAFNNLGIEPRFVDFLNDQMIIFYEIAGGVGVLFWDKSDMDLFDKRIFVPNCKLIAGGVVNGRLMLVTGVGNSSNTKEKNGEIVVSGFDGEKFVQMNSIRAGQRDAQYEEQTGVGIGSNSMVFSISDNTNSSQPDLYENYMYRVKSDGSLEVVWLPDEDLYGEAHIVRVFYNFVLFATRGEGAVAPRIYTNEAVGTGYDHYEDYVGETTYITNFLQEPYNRHKLMGVSVAFEKLFKNLDNPPNIDNETITVSSLLHDSLTLSWSSADDDWQTPEELLYRVYMSTSNNISNEADMIANGTLIQDWAAGINTFPVTGLTELTTYYFNVIVKDGGNQTAVYDTVTATTPEYTIVTPWMSPTQWGDYYPPADAGFTASWSNPGNVVASDDSNATFNAGDIPLRTKWYNFGFAIPPGATILGIETKVEGKWTANPASLNPRININMYKDVVVDGTANLTGTASRSHPQSGSMTNADVVYTRGGYGELWGTTWTPAEINATNFGLGADRSSSSSPSTTNYSMDLLQIRVIYSP